MKINIGQNENRESQDIDYVYENYRPSKKLNSYGAYYGGKRRQEFRWVFQLLISGAILLVVAGLFRYNVPFTGPIKNSVKYLMNTETNVQPVFAKIIQIASQQGNMEWPLVDDTPQVSKTSGTKGQTANQEIKAGEPDTDAILQLPVSGQVSKPFGWAEEAGETIQTFHQGIDIEAPLDTDVKAAASGRVIKTGTDNKSGKYILIKTGNGDMMRYANLSKISAQVEETVKSGDVIGKIGDFEDKKPHLHFELIESSRPVDPLGKLGIGASSGETQKQLGQ